MMQNDNAVTRKPEDPCQTQENREARHNAVPETTSRTICKRKHDVDIIKTNESQNAIHDDTSLLAENPSTPTAVADSDTDSDRKIPCSKKQRLDPGMSAASVLLQFATSAVESPKPDGLQHMEKLHNLHSDESKRVERVILLPQTPTPQVRDHFEWNHFHMMHQQHEQLTRFAVSVTVPLFELQNL